MKTQSNFCRTLIQIIYLVIVLSFGAWVIGTIAKIPGMMAHGETMIKVAIIDTGLNLSDPRFKGHLCEGSKDFSRTGMQDTEGHGTHIAGLIVKNAGKKANYCLLILKYYSRISSGEVNLQNTIDAIKYAGEQGANLVNYSAGGPQPSDAEKAEITRLAWVTFVVAAGNNHVDVVAGRDPQSEKGVHGYYPAAYGLTNVIAVGAVDETGKRASYSNFGPAIDIWECGNQVSTLPGERIGMMRGTSQATAVVTGKLVSGEFNAKELRVR